VFLVFCDLPIATQHRQQVAEPFVDSDFFRPDQFEDETE
jgi:hypothetical protein